MNSINPGDLVTIDYSPADFEYWGISIVIRKYEQLKKLSYPGEQVWELYSTRQHTKIFFQEVVCKKVS